MTVAAVAAAPAQVLAEANIGAGMLGAYPVAVNWHYTEDEARYLFVDSGAKALVLLANMAAAAQDVIPKTGIRQVVVTELADLHPQPRRSLINLAAKHIKKLVPPWHIPGAVPLRRALDLGAAAPHREAAPAAGDLAVLQYTGGTTGVSKGAMLSHESVIQQYVSVMVAAEYSADDTMLHAMPLFHCAQLL
jgi:long-chain acyl-CoA synthetase